MGSDGSSDINGLGNATGGPGGAGGDAGPGSGASDPGGVGGTGGTSGAAFSGGVGATVTSGDGGSGGLGGTGGSASTAAGTTYTNSGTLVGGQGGQGGHGGATGGVGAGADNQQVHGGAGGSAGNGGTGGAGFAASGATIVNSGTITGGAGGSGGTGGNGDTGFIAVGTGVTLYGGNGGNAGNGGDGGAGIAGSNLTIINTGTISGGNGGAAGSAGVAGRGDVPGSAGTAGSIGSSGMGITGSDLTVTNSGTINGGIAFTGGTNSLTLQAGSTIVGNVVAFSAADTLALGGSTNASFDVSQIGAQYQNFGVFQKTGSSTWTLTGTMASNAGWTVADGTLAFSNAASMGSGLLRLNGGTVRATATMTLGNDIAFTGASGTITAATGNTLTLTPTAFSTSFTPNSVITFGSSADTGTVVYAAAISFITNVAFSTVVAGGTLRAGAITFGSLTGNARATTIVNAGATLDFNDFSSTVTNLQGAGSVLTGSGIATTVSIGQGSFAGVISGAGGIVKTGSGLLVLSGANTYTGGTTVSGGTLQGTTTSLQGNILNNANVTFSQSTTGTYAGTLSGTGSVTVNGTGTVILSGANTYGGGTTVSGGLVNFAAANNFGTGAVTLNGGGLQWAAGSVTDISSRLNPLAVGGGTLDTNGNNVTLATAITGNGGLIKAGLGTLTLSGANSYAGGTTINAGTLALAAGASLPTTGTVTINGGTLNVGSNNLSLNTINAAGGSIMLGGGTLIYSSPAATTFAAPINGSGTLAVSGGGTLTLTGDSTFTGTTAVSGSKLVVNGSLASTVTLDATSTIGGNGTIGGLVSSGTIAPGNSIGLLNVNGSFVQNGGLYVVEANAAGQADRVTVNGTAAINGGTVQVVAAQGSYALSTTYTILSATGGRSGTYSSVSSNLAFLTPTLSYDANDVYLTLALLPSGSSPTSANVGFLRGATTGNQAAVATALNLSAAGGVSGDFATVIGALASLSLPQGTWALNQISGQPIANFGTSNVASNTLFMNALGQQMAVARGAQGGQRQALAQACEIEACDGTSPFSVWGNVLGGVGSVQGNGNTNAFTYNLGGAAAGIDYRLDPRFLVGIGTGYTAGTQWVDSFQGKAWSTGVSVAAYGSFTESNVYVDALAGYAYANNQLQQYLAIPGLQPRQANGSTGANAFLGQVETGYRFGVYAPAAATVTPFARFQAASINQAGFSEWGANSLDLNVAQQTTTSLRTTVGADLAGTIGPLLLGLRLGWMHEYADTSRPMTAAFAGAPTQSFTVYGASPQRDSAVIGFSANAVVAENMSLYARYDGEIAAGADNHTLNLGLRLNW